MNYANSLRNVTHLFLDTAPVIYYIERNPNYFEIVKPIFDKIDNGKLIAVTSPVTLAECLVFPYRLGMEQSKRDFLDLIVHGNNVIFQSIDHEQAQQAAELRAKYNITLTDALQIATAIKASCEAFLTNDAKLGRITELHILVLDDLKDAI